MKKTLSVVPTAKVGFPCFLLGSSLKKNFLESFITPLAFYLFWI